MNAEARVSVLIPVFNGERYLAEALDSVLTQTIRDIEVVVVDDGSTDTTPRILAGYASSDDRVVVHRQANRGHGEALNAGLGLCRAPLVARLDADDVAEPHRLASQARFLDRNPTVAVVGGGLRFIDDAGHPFAEAHYPLTNLEIRAAFEKMQTGIAHPAAMIRRGPLGQVQGYRGQFGASEDIDLWLRLMERFDLANLPDVVTRYRVHKEQATVRRLEHQSLCCVAAHLAARARRGGRPDPFEGLPAIDLDAVLERGGTIEEVTSYFVHVATWLARTTGRAGYHDTAATLFAAAFDKARSAGGSPGLVAEVWRSRHQRYREQGQWVRARLAWWRLARTARVH